MFFVICAILAITLAFLVLGNTYENNGTRSHPEWEKCTIPVWGWILIILGCMVPIASTIAIVVFIGMAIAFVSDGMDVRGPIGKFARLLIKEV